MPNISFLLFKSFIPVIYLSSHFDVLEQMSEAATVMSGIDYKMFTEVHFCEVSQIPSPSALTVNRQVHPRTSVFAFGLLLEMWNCRPALTEHRTVCFLLPLLPFYFSQLPLGTPLQLIKFSDLNILKGSKFILPTISKDINQLKKWKYLRNTCLLISWIIIYQVFVFKPPELLLPRSGLVQIKRSAVLLECPKILLASARRGRFSFRVSLSFFPVFPPTLESYNDYILCIISGFFGSHTFQASVILRQTKDWQQVHVGVCMCVGVAFYP